MDLNKLEQITEKLEDEGYEGVDLDLTISLGEYGIVGKELSDNRYKVLYKASYRDKDHYAFQTIDKHYIADLVYSIDQGFLEWTGQSLESWLKLPIINQLHSLVQYHGFMNIFGDMRNSYNSSELYKKVVGYSCD